MPGVLPRDCGDVVASYGMNPKNATLLPRCLLSENKQKNNKE